ncbi:UNVERIFIED_CONTAM: hypothetical protein PYX00_008566 [Menopon gallinae]|uniref:Fanconi anemia group M protein n=1 Tax=Menopon gallinae TaxID=328185 RepID=A0AAW2HNQ8_9NEOP
MIGSYTSQNEDNCVIETLYTGEEAEGFDLSSGSEWIYPTNYPIREYQKSIVSNALFKNTLVCLPTGLGKTFIAAVVMYNYHRWYPKHIIVFTAHSKPLVAQQVNACCNIMGISPSLIAELNGNMTHANRKKQWESKKIFFLTPQVFNNDLARGNVKAENIRCIVIDEAHKALGNQAYCQVIRSIKPFNTHFRVLALSATPGDDMNMVKQVIENLMISHLELRNEEDPDIKPYLHEKKVETIVVKLDNQILEIKDQFLRAVDKYIRPLMRHKLIPQSFSSINPFSLVLKQRQFVQDSNISPGLRGVMMSNFSVAISLFHALEELLIHGMRSFVTKLKCLQTGQGSTSKANNRLVNDDDIKSLIEHVESILGPDHNVSFDANASLTRILDEIDSIKIDYEIVYSHPKFVALEKIIQEHFESFKESTRVIVFCKSRQCTGEICNFLARFRPLVKPMIFIGQSQSSGGIVTKGFNQAAQLTVMKKFREGVYNTLIATCVAEEGLDIGEVDLIINFDSGKNSNTQVQRSGRTGRKRDGRVVNLVTEGKEHQNYNISVSKGKKMSKKLSNVSTKLPFYLGNPRLIPKSVNPVCQEMFFAAQKQTQEEPKEKKKKGKGVKKKLQNTTFEDLPTRKKIKSDDTSEVSLWTMVSQKRCHSPAEVKKVGDVDREPWDDIEIIDLVENENPTMLLYDDDVNQSNNPSSSLSDEILNDERDILMKFFHMNDCRLKPKNKFREMVNLGKHRKHMDLAKHNEKELTRRLRMTQENGLSNSHLDRLQNEDFAVEEIVNYFNTHITSIGIQTEVKPTVTSAPSENSSIKCSDKENKAPAVCDGIMDDLDPNDFIEPLEDLLSSTTANIVSSTPVAKPCIGKKVTGPIEKPEHSILADVNFQNWEESDFGMKEKSSKEVVEPNKNNSSNKKDSSMVPYHSGFADD